MRKRVIFDNGRCGRDVHGVLFSFIYGINSNYRNLSILPILVFTTPRVIFGRIFSAVAASPSSVNLTTKHKEQLYRPGMEGAAKGRSDE